MLIWRESKGLLVCSAIRWKPAGVDIVKELRNRRAGNLYAKIVETNVEKKLAGRNPTAVDVEGWVTQAKEPEPAIEY